MTCQRFEISFFSIYFPFTRTSSLFSLSLFAPRERDRAPALSLLTSRLFFCTPGERKKRVRDKREALETAKGNTAAGRRPKFYFTTREGGKSPNRRSTRHARPLYELAVAVMGGYVCLGAPQEL